MEIRLLQRRCNLFCHFVLNASRGAAPHCKKLRKDQHASSSFLNRVEKDAVENLEKLLTNTPALALRQQRSSTQWTSTHAPCKSFVRYWNNWKDTVPGYLDTGQARSTARVRSLQPRTRKACLYYGKHFYCDLTLEPEGLTSPNVSSKVEKWGLRLVELDFEVVPWAGMKYQAHDKLSNPKTEGIDKPNLDEELSILVIDESEKQQDVETVYFYEDHKGKTIRQPYRQ